MRKVTKISFSSPYIINCVFNNGEERCLDLKKTLNINQKYARKIFEGETFKTAKIGTLGEIYWENIAEIKTIEGKTEPCEYDMSPEVVYLNSEEKSFSLIK